MTKNESIIGKLIYIGCVVLLAMLPFGGSSQSYEPEDIIRKTWEQLSPADKQEISSFEAATVQTVEVSCLSLERYHFTDPIEEMRLYLVTFPSKHRQILGDVERLVDIRSGEILGFSLRD